MNEPQIIFNVLLGLVAFFGGWVLNSLRDSIKSLHESETILTAKIQSVEILVAGSYVKHDDMNRLSSAIFTKLDRIETKLDKKADK